MKMSQLYPGIILAITGHVVQSDKFKKGMNTRQIKIRREKGEKGRGGDRGKH